MAAWLAAPGGGGKDALRDLARASRRQPSFLALAAGVPAAVGLALEGPIERRSGNPVGIAIGLTVGSVAMLAADRRPQIRTLQEADARDGFWLGLAQASALIPGVSRSGATEAVARLRNFSRADSRRLATEAGLPVIAGATLLKGFQVLRRPAAGEGATQAGATVAFGAGASFWSAWLLAPVVRRWSAASLAPYALYRLALAAAILARLRVPQGKTSS